MAINNSYPEIEVLDSGDLLLVSDISQDNSTKLVKIQTLANYIGSGGGGEGSGTVTSVDAIAGTGISVSGGPITTSGTITITNTAPNVTTNLSGQLTSTTVRINSSDGNDVTIDGATSSYAGVMTAADKTKLDGIDNNDYVRNTSDTFGTSAKITQIVTLTQTEYNGITPSSSTLYIIV